MGQAKRSFLYLSRHRGKSLTLFLLLFILGIMVSGAISLERAVRNTEQNLHRTLLPVASIAFDFPLSQEQRESFFEEGGTQEEWFEVLATKRMSSELLQKLADFPGVLFSDFTAETRVLSEEVTTTGGFGQITNDLVELSLKGASTVRFSDLEADIIEIVYGRNFSEEELRADFSDGYSVLVSSSFARANNLTVGSNFSTVNATFDYGNQELTFEERWSRDNALYWGEYIFHVIGIFEGARTVNTGAHGQNVVSASELDNRIYVPFHLASRISQQLSSRGRRQHLELGWMDEALFNYLENLDFTPTGNILFILENTEKLREFEQFGEEILPEVYRIQDLSFAYSDIVSSVELTGSLLVSSFRAGIIAMLIIMGLIILLYLRDRKQEYAIYLSLGAKKFHIYLQTLLEILLPAILSLTLAIFLGNFLATNISTAMVIEELAYQQAQPVLPRQVLLDGIKVNYETGAEILYWFAPEFGIDEMLEAFDISLNSMDFLNFFLLSFGVVLGASLLSFFYIIRINPKKLLEST